MVMENFLFSLPQAVKSFDVDGIISTFFVGRRRTNFGGVSIYVIQLLTADEAPSRKGQPTTSCASGFFRLEKPSAPRVWDSRGASRRCSGMRRMPSGGCGCGGS